MQKSINKELLEKLYLEDKKSFRKIAHDLNVGKTTIEYYIKKFGIKRRSYDDARKLCSKELGWTRGLTKKDDERILNLANSIKKAFERKRKEKILNIENKFGKPIKDLLEFFYWQENLSQQEISKKLMVDRSIIIELMKKFNIPKRPKYQYISSLKGLNHPQYGKTWEEIMGHEMTIKRKRETSIRFRKLTIQRLENNNFPFFNTKIEKKIAKKLINRKIPFVKQFRIENRFVCDFAIPLYKIIIECDGDYWHANPKFYSNNQLTKTQKNKITTDKLKDNLLRKKGWTVLRFFESDINNDINKCIIEIENTIGGKKEELKKIKSPLDNIMKEN